MFHSKLAVMALVLAVAGCSAVPIMNIKEAPVVSASGKAMSSAEVRSAIVRAGTTLGWQIKDEGPNMLVGTIILRDHSAVVEIPYSAKNYSIKYRSSTNLKESGGSIHKNYNGWIQNLTRGINAQLTAS